MNKATTRQSVLGVAL